MGEKNRSDAKQFIVRMVLVAPVVLSSLALAGCTKQLSRIEENQLKMQAMAQTNAQQIAGSVARIEETQSKLQSAIKDVQARAEQTNISMTAVSQEQTKLQGTLQKTSEQITGDISRLEQDQLEFATNMLTHIGSIADLAGEISTVQQGRLEHQKRSSADIRTIAELTGKISTAQQGQLQNEDKMLADLRAIAEAINTIEQKQSTLEGQMGQVQDGTDVMRKGIIAFLKQLGADLSEISEQLDSAGTATDEPSAADPNEQSDQTRP